MKLEKLFEPANIGKALIKNRIAMAPMGVVGLVDCNGGLTQRAIGHYVERAYRRTGVTIGRTLEFAFSLTI